ncbi:hypothetical protein [Streptosporangium carneum]|uniref:Uncharacterized protein n=1 Tax=Streptosporangium carneum TaxID=47481 RepID=A0A9W6I5N2_9ACTN|nr:hypothetical protein [Streptosporangium carneum]GLK12157.1 hypothetical protein GCM10017600_55650 [Streptosporangium carneum]
MCALLAHLSWVTAMFAALPGRQEAPPQDGDHTAFEGRAGEMLAAWSEPGAFEGDSPAMGVPMTTVFLMGLGDIVIRLEALTGGGPRSAGGL